LSRNDSPLFPPFLQPETVARPRIVDRIGMKFRLLDRVHWALTYGVSHSYYPKTAPHDTQPERGGVDGATGKHRRKQKEPRTSSARRRGKEARSGWGARIKRAYGSNRTGAALFRHSKGKRAGRNRPLPTSGSRRIVHHEAPGGTGSPRHSSIFSQNTTCQGVGHRASPSRNCPAAFEPDTLMKSLFD
jgi:hypothetical protein